MGSKKVNTFHLITDGSMTGTSTLTSAIQNVQNFDNLGLQVKWTGTPTGTFSVLGSVDGVNFVALTFTPSLTQPSGSSNDILISLNQFPWPYLEVQYVNASGTGALNVFLNSKDLN